MPIVHNAKTGDQNELTAFIEPNNTYGTARLAQTLVTSWHRKQVNDAVIKQNLDFNDVYSKQTSDLRAYSFICNDSQIVLFSFYTSKPQAWWAAVDRDDGTAAFIYPTVTDKHTLDEEKNLLLPLDNDETYKKVITFIMDVNNQLDKPKLDMISQLAKNGEAQSSVVIDIESNKDKINTTIDRYNQLIHINFSKNTMNCIEIMERTEKKIIQEERYNEVKEGKKFTLSTALKPQDALEQYKKKLILACKDFDNDMFQEKIVDLRERIAAAEYYFKLMLTLFDLYRIGSNYPELNLNDFLSKTATQFSMALLDEKTYQDYSNLLRTIMTTISRLQVTKKELSVAHDEYDSALELQSNLPKGRQFSILNLFLLSGSAVGIGFCVHFIALGMNGAGPFAGAAAGGLYAAFVIGSAASSLCGLIALCLALSLICGIICYNNSSEVPALKKEILEDKYAEYTENKPKLQQQLNDAITTFEEGTKRLQQYPHSTNPFALFSATNRNIHIDSSEEKSQQSTEGTTLAFDNNCG